MTEAIGHISDLVYVCAPAPLQMGVAAGINELAESFYADLCEEFHGKREQICNALDSAGLPPYAPQGSYYVLADASSLPGSTSKEKAMHILSETGVATVPGSAFYSKAGDNQVRLCFAKPAADLDAACKRLETLRI